jgi:hypothetical protein
MIQLTREPGVPEGKLRGCHVEQKGQGWRHYLCGTQVDDSILTGSDDDQIDTLVREMLDRFDGTCERNLTKMLGMK